MKKIQPLSEMVEQKIAEQAEAQRQAELHAAWVSQAAAEAERFRVTDAERRVQEETQRQAKHAAQRDEMRTVLQADAQRVAAFLLEREVPQDIWKGRVQRERVAFKLFGRSEYAEFDRRNMIGWLAALHVRGENRIIGTKYHEGSTGGGYAEYTTPGWTENITSLYHHAQPVILTAQGGLVTLAGPIQFGDEKPTFDDVRLLLNNDAHVFTSVDAQDRKGNRTKFAKAMGIDYIDYTPWAEAGIGVAVDKFEKTRMGLTELVVANTK